MVGNGALIRCKINKTIDKQNPFDVFIAPFGKQMVIGRDLGSDFRIDSIEVSRRHAILETQDNNWFVTDLESTNGLYLNGKQLIPYTPQCIKNGDRLSFGPSKSSKLIYKFVCNEVPKRLVKSSKRKVSLEESYESDPKRNRNEFEELFDSELSCSICHELFVTPINLNCSHTFCLSCIEEWKHSNKVNQKSDILSESPETNCCPICRQPIVSQNRVLALDNVIDYLINKWTPELSEQRQRLVCERKRQISS